jgi:hypothetical protein
LTLKAKTKARTKETGNRNLKCFIVVKFKIDAYYFNRCSAIPEKNYAFSPITLDLWEEGE